MGNAGRDGARADMMDLEPEWLAVVQTVIANRRPQIARKWGIHWDPTLEWIEGAARATQTAFNAEADPLGAKTAALDCLERLFTIAEADPSMRASA